MEADPRTCRAAKIGYPAGIRVREGLFGILFFKP